MLLVIISHRRFTFCGTQVGIIRAVMSNMERTKFPAISEKVAGLRKLPMVESRDHLGLEEL